MAEVLHLEHGVTRLAVHFRVSLTHFATDHHGHHLLFADVADFAGTDITAITQNRVVIGNGENLVELVRDKQDSFTLAFQAFNNLIKLNNFMLRQRGGRFIENNHLGIKRQRTGNRHHMTLRDTQVFQGGVRVNVHFQTRQNIACLLMHCRPVQAFKQPAIDVMADKNILGDGKLVEQHGFLMNGGNANFVCGFGIWQFDWNRFITQFAFFRLINAGHDFHQRRFSRAVFANQGGYFSRIQIHVNVI